MASYSYDRTAAREPKPEPVVPWKEKDEVLRSLTAAQWIVKEWGIRAHLATSGGSNEVGYVTTPQKARTIFEIRKDLDELAERIRHL